MPEQSASQLIDSFSSVITTDGFIEMNTSSSICGSRVFVAVFPAWKKWDMRKKTSVSQTEYFARWHMLLNLSFNIFAFMLWDKLDLCVNPCRLHPTFYLSIFFVFIFFEAVLSKRGWASRRKWSSATSRTQTRPPRAAPRPRTSLSPEGSSAAHHFGFLFCTFFVLCFFFFPLNVADVKPRAEQLKWRHKPLPCCVCVAMRLFCFVWGFFFGGGETVENVALLFCWWGKWRVNCFLMSWLYFAGATASFDFFFIFFFETLLFSNLYWL